MKSNFKLYSSEEVIDEIIGEKGTQKRYEFDKKVEKDVKIFNNNKNCNSDIDSEKL